MQVLRYLCQDCTVQRKLLLEEILYRYGNNNNKKINLIAPFYSPSIVILKYDF